MIITDFHSVISTPITNLSVNLTIKTEIRNHITPSDNILKGSVISLNIPHNTRFTRPRINIKTSKEVVHWVKTTPGR